MKSSQSVSAKGNNPAKDERSESRQVKTDLFREEVCQVYDLLLESGMDPKEAIRKTRSALKAINYPFATYDNVMAKLRASGRLRKHRHMQSGDDTQE